MKLKSYFYNIWKKWLGTKKWPRSVINYKGHLDVPRFESSRQELLPPKEDIFK